MLNWAQFESQMPEMAVAGRRLLFHPGFGFAYLATVGRDGSPRIHPVNVLIAADRLLAFITPSPKLQDLRETGRFALHSSQTETVDDEFMIRGSVVLRDDDPHLRDRALDGHLLTVAAADVLVELLLYRVVWVHYVSPGMPVVSTWRFST